MSESRQRFTGRVILLTILFVCLWLLFVTLPLFTRYLHITTVDPRWLTPADLTWQRIVFNVLTKPGMRLLLVLAIGMVVSVCYVGFVARAGVRRQVARRRVDSSSFSAEWVIDGAWRTHLMDYGRFVGVV